MSKSTTRAQVAGETLAILQKGWYISPSKQRISVRDELASSSSRSVLYAPGHFEGVFQRVDQLLQDRHNHSPVTFEVVNETTLHAARRLLNGEPELRVLALIFASAAIQAAASSRAARPRRRAWHVPPGCMLASPSIRRCMRPTSVTRPACTPTT
jgi:hypothetical protein